MFGASAYLRWEKMTDLHFSRAATNEILSSRNGKVKELIGRKYYHIISINEAFMTIHRYMFFDYAHINIEKYWTNITTMRKSWECGTGIIRPKRGGENEVSFIEQRDYNVLQNCLGACRELMCEIRVRMLTESKAPRISTKVAKNNSLLLKEWYIFPMNDKRHSSVPLPFLKAKRLSGRKEFDSNHQSSLDLTMCSKILHKEEESAIGRNEVLEFCLAMGITLYAHHKGGICWFVKILFIEARRASNALAGRCFNITGEILSRPDAVDFLEAIAYVEMIC